MSSERVKALWEFGKVIFGRNNLIGTAGFEPYNVPS